MLLGSCADKPQQSQGDGEEARFVDSVVARMDLKQKTGQLVQSSVVRPVLEHKDFRRVEIPAGQTVDVTFDLPVSRLEFFGLDN